MTRTWVQADRNQRGCGPLAQVFYSADRQEWFQRQFAPSGKVPVILGTGEARWAAETGCSAIETSQKDLEENLAKGVDEATGGA